MKQLSDEGARDILVVVGGNIPKRDFKALENLGVKGVFQTGSKFDEIIEFIKNESGGVR